MARRSVQSLMVEESGFAAEEVRRPDPPNDLTEEEATEWRRIVACMPARHFIPANHHLLTQLCRHISTSRQVALYIQMFRRHKDPEHVRLYNDLCKTQENETLTIYRLSRSMRLSQQATFFTKQVKLDRIASHSAENTQLAAIAAAEAELEDAW